MKKFISFVILTGLLIFEAGHDVKAESSNAVDKKTKVMELLSIASDYSCDNSKNREEAIKKLINLDNADLKYLIEGLGTKDVNKQHALLSVFTGIGKPSTDLLCKGLRKKSEGTAFTIFILGKIGDCDCKSTIRFYLYDQSIDILKSSVFASGKMRDKKAFKKLIQLLKDPFDPIRKDAVISLGEINDDKAIPYLVKSLNDPIFTVRFTASDVLSKFQEKDVDKVKNELKDFLTQSIPLNVRMLVEKTLERIEHRDI
jgi:HEAT repeat protein